VVIQKTQPQAAADLLTIDEVMALTKMKRAALSQRRYRRAGPPFIKRGNTIRYRAARLRSGSSPARWRPPMNDQGPTRPRGRPSQT